MSLLKQLHIAKRDIFLTRNYKKLLKEAFCGYTVMLLTLSLRIYNNATYSQFPNSRGQQNSNFGKIYYPFHLNIPLPSFFDFP